MLNRVRWQDDEDSVKLRTHSDYVEREGKSIIDFIEKKADKVLTENGFDTVSGKPIDIGSVSDSMKCPEFPTIPTEEINEIVDKYNEGKDRSRQIDETQILFLAT